MKHFRCFFSLLPPFRKKHERTLFLSASSRVQFPYERALLSLPSNRRPPPFQFSPLLAEEMNLRLRPERFFSSLRLFSFLDCRRAFSVLDHVEAQAGLFLENFPLPFLLASRKSLLIAFFLWFPLFFPFPCRRLRRARVSLIRLS